MHITFVDKKSNINSNTLNLKAIDSIQKNLIFFAQELVKRNHKISIINQSTESRLEKGINWLNINNIKNFSTDVLVIIQDLDGLKIKFSTKKKILWIVGKYSIFFHKALLTTLLKEKYKIIYDNYFLIDALPHNFRLVPKFFLGNAVDDSFYRINPGNTFRNNALVTTHPLRGLDWLLEVWSKFIHNKLPWAELHIYSELLSRPGTSENIKINNLKLRLYSFKNNGIVVKKPMSLNLFQKELSQYRVHLNPAIDNDVPMLSLLESQAAGIPVVSRVNNIVYNLINDNETGYITNDINKFTLKTVTLLSDKKKFSDISRNSKNNNNIKLWKEICDYFESNIL